MATNVAGQTASQSQAQDSPSRCFGTDVYDGTSITTTDVTAVTLGFKARYVRWENATDRIMCEWFEGMAADSCIKTAANGTRTLEISSGNHGITVTQLGFTIAQNATLGAIAASKTCYWRADG